MSAARVERCASPGGDCDRERRWNAKRGGWLWHCPCGRVFPETDGTPSSVPLRGDPDPYAALCPLCSSPMVHVRGTRNGDFWSCSRYPKCKGTRPFSQKISK